MPKYLFQASYTPDGAKGVLKEGGTQRRTAVEKTLKSLGAKLECFYYAMGEDDAVLIVDAPDNASVAAISMAINSTAAVRLRTTVLLTPEDIDVAAKKTVDYRPPGR
jgi:uncharacterized protein with GYD domain